MIIFFYIMNIMQTGITCEQHCMLHGRLQIKSICCIGRWGSLQYWTYYVSEQWFPTVLCYLDEQGQVTQFYHTHFIQTPDIYFAYKHQSSSMSLSMLIVQTRHQALFIVLVSSLIILRRLLCLGSIVSVSLTGRLSAHTARSWITADRRWTRVQQFIYNGEMLVDEYANCIRIIELTHMSTTVASCYITDLKVAGILLFHSSSPWSSVRDSLFIYFKHYKCKRI